MQIETINYVELRELMDRVTPEGKAVPFSIVYVTADRQKQTGGDFVTHAYAIKHSNLTGKRKVKRFATPTNQSEVNGTPPLGAGGLGPNHFKNQTTNLAILARDSHTHKLVFTGEIKKIHYRLVLFINQKEVMY